MRGSGRYRGRKSDQIDPKIVVHIFFCEKMIFGTFGKFWNFENFVFFPDSVSENLDFSLFLGDIVSNGHCQIVDEVEYYL